jgi:hypothetical protein
MSQFLVEWQRLRAFAQTEEDNRLLDSIEQLARQCMAEGAHVYLKFQGD